MGGSKLAHWVTLGQTSHSLSPPSLPQVAKLGMASVVDCLMRSFGSGSGPGGLEKPEKEDLHLQNPGGLWSWRGGGEQYRRTANGQQPDGIGGSIWEIKRSRAAPPQRFTKPPRSAPWCPGRAASRLLRRSSIGQPGAKRRDPAAAARSLASLAGVCGSSPGPGGQRRSRHKRLPGGWRRSDKRAAACPDDRMSNSKSGRVALLLWLLLAAGALLSSQGKAASRSGRGCCCRCPVGRSMA